ncbi:putative holo-acyl-carrier-protein synthase protein [Botrytis cinerea BcDW1]|uniref:Putative holo-acyl-carrier-protein synthase protein n=1 Tax=Botryotinia fuckeliana (strain BcDW1) TaxID=1290391 RepID=M7U2H3_BOTF1|nr:putative holo-acyl-carrier-protein synthase protein [Botrytis cinerea BcDW1]
MERREFIQGKIEKQERWKAKSLEALIGLVAPKEAPLLNNTAAIDSPVGSLIWPTYGAEDSKKLTKEEEESILLQLKENVQGVARFVAGRFAAKEAAKKAFSKRKLNFHDITIDSPSLDNLRSRAPVTLIKSITGHEDQIVPMSISHDGDYATAVCMSCEDVAPPPTPDLQQIEPMLARLLDEITIKRLELSSASSRSLEKEKRTPNSTLKDSTSETSSERLSTPLQKIPVKLTSPISGRLSEILNSTPGGGSNISAPEVREDLNVPEVSDRLESEASSSSMNDPVIDDNLDVSKIPSHVPSEASLPSPNDLKIRYHVSAASAHNSLNVDLLNGSSIRNSPDFEERGFTYRGIQTSNYQPMEDSQRDRGFPQPSDDYLVHRSDIWTCKSEGCGSQNSFYDRQCVNCGTKRLEGWVNYVDLDSKYNERLAEFSNHLGLPFEIDPAKEEEKKMRVAVRQARLHERSQSIYGLPTYIDPKVVKKNVENSLKVTGIPSGTTNEELIEAFKGKCTAIKGYVKQTKMGDMYGSIILSRENEANKLRHIDRRPDKLPEIRGSKLRMHKTDDWLRGLLRDYGSGARAWDWIAEFWTTDVFHQYDKKECDEHAKQRLEVWRQAQRNKQKQWEAEENKMRKKLKKLEKGLEEKGTRKLAKLVEELKQKLEDMERGRSKRKLEEGEGEKEKE